MKRVIFFVLMMVSSVCFGHGYAYVPPPTYYQYYTPGGGIVTGWSPTVPLNMRGYEIAYPGYYGGYRGHGYLRPVPQSYYNFSFGQYGGHSGFGISIGGVR